MATQTRDFTTRYGVTAGTLVKGSTLQSTVSTGTAPMVVASTTMVANLNVERLGGNLASAFVTNVMTTLGDLTIGGASGAFTRLAGNTAVQPSFLSSAGNGTTAAAATLTSSTGSGNVVLATSPTLVTPVLGVATATSINKITLTQPATGSTLTIIDGKTATISNTLTFTGTDASSVAFGTGGTVAYTANKLSVFAATTSAELKGVISDETGTGGALVFADTPTLITPVLGVATATSINKVTITAPATSATLTVADGKTATISNTLTFTGTDSSSVAFGAGGTVAYQGGTLGQFAATTSAALAGVISDETGGSGVLMFNASPAVSTSLTTGSASFDLIDTTATTVNFARAATALTIAATTGTTTIRNALIVTGDLTVNGTTTTVNATTMTVDDKNIELGSVGSPSNTTADGGGITLKGATDKTFNWVNATGAWTSSEDLDLASGKVLRVNGTQVLSATQYTGNAATATTASALALTNADISSDTVTVTANSTPTTLDTFAVATYTSAMYLVQMKQGTKVTTTNLMVMWDGTDVSVSEFGYVDATAGAANATLTATHSAGTMTVSASSPDAATTNVVIKALTHYVKA